MATQNEAKFAEAWRALDEDSAKLWLEYSANCHAIQLAAMCGKTPSAQSGVHAYRVHSCSAPKAEFSTAMQRFHARSC